MKKNTLFFALSALLYLSCSNHTQIDPSAAMPMCHDPNADVKAFAAFASDPAFQAAHPYRRPESVTHQGEMVEFPTEGGPNGKAFLMKSHQATNKYLLVFHEWWGLNDNIKNEVAAWCHDLNVNVIALDLYDGKMATTPDEAGKLMQGNDPVRSAAIIAGAAKYLGDKAELRTVGWCFGGGWSLKAALQLGKKVKGCVVYYGMPETKSSVLKKLKCDVVFIHPLKDKWITEQVVKDFQAGMKKAKKKVSVYRYDADHAFANPSSPRYDEAAAKASRVIVKNYLSSL